MGDLRVRLLEVLHSTLAKSIGIQQSLVSAYVAGLRRARPDAMPAEIVVLLEKQYLAAITGTGAAVGGAATAPGVGTAVAFALNGAEATVFLEATVLFALSVAEVHGIRVEEVERRQTLVLAVMLGDHASMLVEKMVGRTGEHWGDLLPDLIPVSSVIAINKTLGNWFMTRFGSARGILAIGRIAPFGIGAAVGGAGNLAFGRVVVNTSRRVFGLAPAHFADQNSVPIVNGRLSGFSLRGFSLRGLSLWRRGTRVETAKQGSPQRDVQNTSQA